MAQRLGQRWWVIGLKELPWWVRVLVEVVKAFRLFRVGLCSACLALALENLETLDRWCVLGLKVIGLKELP